ncbi:hypothetical protein [Parabacteroides sp. FAFU027]|uniref:hypothetical protein n=1 Tax=Parabacteroides sp. FAFU027 TaxID=2922715 RepID=UPI001FAFBB96|nr:hypothetical protein [Parabacteroides sp. FAFU027]
MKQLLLVLALIGLSVNGKCQNNPEFLLWNTNHRLTVDDFGIKKGHTTSQYCFAQFSIEYNVKGFDFFTSNFNKKVKNCLIKSASWIDTTQYTAQSLRYQQTLFDMAEIYVRRFRKELRENKKKLFAGLSIVDQLNAKNSADFTKRRLQYDSETKSGTIEEQQKIWKQTIQAELNELSEFAYDK